MERENSASAAAEGNAIRSVVVLGNDAIAAAFPATRAQLADACRAAGFDVVLGATTGEELIARAYLETLGAMTDRAVIACSCPSVAELLDDVGPARRPPTVTLVAPPVASARYARAVHGASVTVAYVGHCCGATDPEIDVRYTPADFLALLDRRGIRVGASEVPEASDQAFDGARFTSVAGGLPALRLLARAPVSRLLREVTRESLERGELPLTRSNVLLDVSADAGCACVVERARVEELEPPRAMSPVVEPPASLDLAPRALTAEPAVRPVTAVTEAVPMPIPEPVASPVAPPAGPPAWRTTNAATSRTRTAGRAASIDQSRRRPVLVPALIAVAAVATLGVAAYRLAAGSNDRPRTAVSAGGTAVSPAAGVDSASEAALPTPPTGPTTAAVNPAREPAGRGERAASRPRAADSVSSDSLHRPRRAPRYRVVPGWMPQGQGRWEPLDTTRRRLRDTVPRGRPPAAPRDTMKDQGHRTIVARLGSA